MLRASLVLAFATVAAADDAGNVRRETLTVGETVERDVGFAIGVVCDHPDVVGAAMKTAPSGKANVLVLTAKRPGQTTCRAGTDPNRISFVYTVAVVAKR